MFPIIEVRIQFYFYLCFQEKHKEMEPLPCDILEIFKGNCYIPRKYLLSRLKSQCFFFSYVWLSVLSLTSEHSKSNKCLHNYFLYISLYVQYLFITVHTLALYTGQVSNISRLPSSVFNISCYILSQLKINLLKNIYQYQWYVS